MALTYRSVSAAIDGTFTQSLIYCDKPAGAVEGDLLTAAFMSIRGGGESATHSLPTGGTTWNMRREETLSILGSAYTVRIGIYDKVCGGSEPSNYLFECSNSTTLLVKIGCYSGPAGSPYQTNTYVTGTGTSIALSSITTEEADEMLIGFVWSLGAGTGTTFTSSALTERGDSDSLWIGDVFQSGAGASGSKTVTGADSGDYMGFLMAYKSATGGGGGGSGLLHTLLSHGLTV